MKLFPRRVRRLFVLVIGSCTLLSQVSTEAFAQQIIIQEDVGSVPNALVRVTDVEGETVEITVQSSAPNFGSQFNPCVHVTTSLELDVICSRYEWDSIFSRHLVFFEEDLDLSNLPSHSVYVPYVVTDPAQVTLLSQSGDVIGVYDVYSTDHIQAMAVFQGVSTESFRWINTDDPLTSRVEATVQFK